MCGKRCTNDHIDKDTDYFIESNQEYQFIFVVLLVWMVMLVWMSMRDNKLLKE